MSQHLHLQGRQKHPVSLDSVRILDHEADEDGSGIRAAVYIRMLHPDLNKDRGHHQLPHILHAASDLQLQDGEWQFHHH